MSVLNSASRFLNCSRHDCAVCRAAHGHKPSDWIATLETCREIGLSTYIIDQRFKNLVTQPAPGVELLDRKVLHQIVVILFGEGRVADTSAWCHCCAWSELLCFRRGWDESTRIGFRLLRLAHRYTAVDAILILEVVAPPGFPVMSS